jgi:hypothetical protein
LGGSFKRLSIAPAEIVRYLTAGGGFIRYGRTGAAIVVLRPVADRKGGLFALLRRNASTTIGPVGTGKPLDREVQ